MDFIFIVVSIGAVALAFLLQVVFGTRNLIRGKHSWFTVGVVVIPFLLFGVVAVITGGAMAKSAILTVLLMVLLAILGLAYSGLRGLTG